MSCLILIVIENKDSGATKKNVHPYVGFHALGFFIGLVVFGVNVFFGGGSVVKYGNQTFPEDVILWKLLKLSVNIERRNARCSYDFKP